MELIKEISPACRPSLPRFYFVDVYKPAAEPRKSDILSNFTIGDLENKTTAASVTEALYNVTK